MKDGPRNDIINFHEDGESTIQNIIEDETVHFPTIANDNIEKTNDVDDGEK